MRHWKLQTDQFSCSVQSIDWGAASESKRRNEAKNWPIMSGGTVKCLTDSRHHVDIQWAAICDDISRRGLPQLSVNRLLLHTRRRFFLNLPSLPKTRASRIFAPVHRWLYRGLASPTHPAPCAACRHVAPLLYKGAYALHSCSGIDQDIEELFLPMLPGIAAPRVGSGSMYGCHPCCWMHALLSARACVHQGIAC